MGRDAGRRLLLRRFLEAYWLRPENAFWMTLRSMALERCAFDGPSLDLSCGDGIFSFLHAGGRFDPAFDVFQAAGNLDRVTSEHADMFDAPAPGYAPPIIARPDRMIDIGIDLKPAMLEKAAALGFYGRLIHHDNNEPLPLEDGSLATVYSNSVYWVREIDRLLAELARVTGPVGRVILHVKLAHMRNYTLEAHRDALGDRFLEIIGRGRMACWPSLATRAEWERRFARAGLAVELATPFATRTHAHLWDVGLRPIAPLLVRMANALTPQTRAAVKQDWVALLEELLTPICREDFELVGGEGGRVAASDGGPAEVQYVLRRR